ncbi:MAG: tyrosine-protein phosphatase [Oscillospiraceae bacterium]|nr:tyrosine-protein phosphatase [Oscillospiraceae bacterium]
MKRILTVLLLLTMCASLLSGCGAAKEGQIKAKVKKDQKYGAATVLLSQEEFESAGFALGDSCDITFSNGYTLKDVPYYNGYYVKNDAPVLVAYPGFANISITLNNKGIWDTARLKEGAKVTIRLRESGKYAPVQESLGQVYSFNREDYSSDAEFCNYRSCIGAWLFRGASPVDNSRGRAAYTDGLLGYDSIDFILDLADTEEDMKGYFEAEDFQSSYTRKLYEDGRIALLGMSSSYQSQAYKEALVHGLRKLLEAEPRRIYIHCMEGKDRTGFVCLLLEALSGQDYHDMERDYMLTYQNYYSITKKDTPEKYTAVRELYFDAMVAYLYGSEDMTILRQADYKQAAENYLLEGGMTSEELAALEEGYFARQPVA